MNEERQYENTRADAVKRIKALQAELERLVALYGREAVDEALASDPDFNSVPKLLDDYARLGATVETLDSTLDPLRIERLIEETQRPPETEL